MAKLGPWQGRGQIDLVSEQQQNIVKNPSARESESDPHKLIDMLLAAGGLGSRADGLERKTRPRSNFLRCRVLAAGHMITNHMISDH